MVQCQDASERLSHLQGAILALIAEGERVGVGGAYGRWEIREKLRHMRISDYLAMSFPRSMRNLAAKGLIDHIPYYSRGQACGYLLGLSAKG